MGMWVSLYGCSHCLTPRQAWRKPARPIAPPLRLPDPDRLNVLSTASAMDHVATRLQIVMSAVMQTLLSCYTAISGGLTQNKKSVMA